MQFAKMQPLLSRFFSLGLIASFFVLVILSSSEEKSRFEEPDYSLREECYALISQWLTIRADAPREETNLAMNKFFGSPISQKELFEKLSALVPEAPKPLCISLDKEANKMRIIFEKKNTQISVALFFFFDEYDALKDTTIVLGFADLKSSKAEREGQGRARGSGFEGVLPKSPR